MTKQLAPLVGFIVGVVAVLSLFAVLYSRNASASAIPGLAATVATSSNPIVGTTAALVFATTTGGNCSARIITTYQYPIMITFADKPAGAPTATYGHLQPASTTVAYDSGLYGCNAVRVYGYTGSVAITVTETR